MYPMNPLYRPLCLTFVLSLFTFLAFGQIASVHSNMQNMDLCTSQSGTITFTNTGSFTANDSIQVVLPVNTEVSYSAISVSSGAFSQANDTITIHSLPDIATVDLSYTLTLNCDAFDIDTYELKTDYSYAFNAGSWEAHSSNAFNVSSPVLNFIGGEQLHYNNAFLGTGVERCFYLTNTNNSVPFNGVVEFWISNWWIIFNC